MISLNEYYKNIAYNNNILIETSNLIIDEIINESFQSSLLSNLAKRIKEVEKSHREDDKKREKYYKEQGYLSTPTKTEKTFASIFGPLIKSQKYGDPKTGIQGLKWSEIKDSDFKQYKGDDKEFIKLLKSLYAKKIKADVIICEPNTKNIIYFIKGYSDTHDIRVYCFDSGKSYETGVQEKTAKKYKYDVRALKADETLALIKNLDVYFLEINDSMIKDYDQLHKDRKESQKGIINYDEESLKDLLKQQQARYKKMIEEARKMKLASDPNKLLDDIETTNNEVIDLFRQVINNPDNLDQRFDMDDLMRYTSYAYEQFYKAMIKGREADKYDTKYPGKNAGEFDREQSKEYFENAKEYLDTIKKKIAEIKQNIK